MSFELQIPNDCSWEHWCKLASYAASIRRATSWALADLMVYADKHNWLEQAIGYLTTLGYRRTSILNFLRVGLRFPIKQRKWDVPYSLYQMVSAHEDAQQLLAKAAVGDGGVAWSHDQFYSYLAAHREAAQGPVERSLKPRSRPRARYNRPHQEDPFGTFKAMALQTATAIREIARTKMEIGCKCECLAQIDEALMALLRARNVLARSINQPTAPIQLNGAVREVA